MRLTNTKGLPDVFLKACEPRKQTSDISVTQLIDSPRAVQLKKRHYDSLEVDVSDQIWALFGTAIHNVLEKSADTDALVEENLSITMNGWKISGMADWFDGKVLCDYKTTSAWTIVYKSQVVKWEEQLNLYAHLYRAHGFKPEKLQIVAILKDWSKMKMMQSEDYPRNKVIVINVDLWSEEKAKLFLETKVELHQSQEPVADENLILCSKEERWEDADKWAVMKRGGKRALKLCDTQLLAQEIVDNKWKDAEYIEHRPAVARRCQEYCDVSAQCSQFNKGDSR